MFGNNQAWYLFLARRIILQQGKLGKEELNVVHTNAVFCNRIKSRRVNLFASAANRTRGPSMATMDFTTKPLTLGVLFLMN